MFPNVAKIGSGNYLGNISWKHKTKQATSHPPEGMEGWKGGTCFLFKTGFKNTAYKNSYR
jgi:hypothetical protein